VSYTISNEEHDRWMERYEDLCKRYPHENDPRRDCDWASRTPASETNQLLCAILDELYKINDRSSIV
jgi:hypothetical protein